MTPWTYCIASRRAKMTAKHLAAAAILLVVFASAKAQECYAIETDLKYNIPLGVYGTNSGCIKGSLAQGSCKPSAPLSGTRTEGSFSSLAACCAEVESRTEVDPRNGRPMPEQANVKAACLAYKKNAAGGALPADPTEWDRPGKPCFSVEVEKEGQVLGIWATYGGCIKGVLSNTPTRTCDPTYPLWGGNKADRPAYHSSLENCCREVESRSGHKGVKESCLAYKKAHAATPPAAPKAPAPAAAPADDSWDRPGKPCFSVEVEKEGQPLGIWATYGGCIKGKISNTPKRTCEPTDPLWGGNRVDRPAYHWDLQTCCAEVESRTGHKGVKESCLAYKKAVNPKP